MHRRDRFVPWTGAVRDALLALCLVVVGGSGAALGQETPPAGIPVGEPTPERPGLFRAGTFYLTPYIHIGSMGIDTNVFYTATDRQTDFTDRVTLGKNVIVGGRNSSLWTHNRQETAPIEVGDFCYLGSEVRLAPGAKLPDECILGLGSVLTGEIREPRSLVAGVPAKVVRPLNEKDLARIRRKTRRDMPDDYYECS